MMSRCFLRELERLEPFQFVWLVAGFLAVMYWERAPIPSLLTLIGVIISVVGVYLASLSFYYTICVGRTNNRDGELLLLIIDWFGQAMRVVGLCLFVAAIFVGRSHAPRADRYLHE